MSQTAKPGLQNLKHEHELSRLKLECQEEKIKHLTAERDFLKGQLSESTRKTSHNSQPSHEAMEKSNSDSLLSSESSDSSNSSDSSSDDGKKKKRKKSKKKTKKQKGKNQKGKKGSKTATQRYASRGRSGQPLREAVCGQPVWDEHTHAGAGTTRGIQDEGFVCFNGEVDKQHSPGGSLAEAFPECISARGLRCNYRLLYTETPGDVRGLAHHA
ncbi:unnamed protein product, partial [Arctogadus glacialis]